MKYIVASKRNRVFGIRNREVYAQIVTRAVLKLCPRVLVQTYDNCYRSHDESLHPLETRVANMSLPAGGNRWISDAEKSTRA